MSQPEGSTLLELIQLLSFAYPHPRHRLVCMRYFQHEPKGPVLMCALCGQGSCYKCFVRDKGMHIYYRNYGSMKWGVCPHCGAHVELIIRNIAQVNLRYETFSPQFESAYKAQAPEKMCVVCGPKLGGLGWYKCSACGDPLCANHLDYCLREHCRKADHDPDTTSLLREEKHAHIDHLLHDKRRAEWSAERLIRKVAA